MYKLLLVALALWALWRMVRRAMVGTGTPSQRTVSGDLSAHDAADILGINLPASKAQVESAWRERMQQHHPDHGGSDYFASKINEARDLLLRIAKE